MTKSLIAAGWTEDRAQTLRKGNWIVVFDTSSWMILATDTTPRVYDVPVPQSDSANLTQWTVGLIEHLLETHDGGEA
ncbi:hypothetical protein [Roseobacter cerasinus]|nr:hypothetical protein [Roseobacter cerasinus]